MKTPFLDKILNFYESIPALNITYTLTLVEYDGGFVYETKKDVPPIDFSSVSDLGSSVVEHVKASTHIRLNGSTSVENSFTRFREGVIDEVYTRMHRFDLKHQKSIMNGKLQAAEDCTAFLVYENTLASEMRMHLLKSIIKKYKDKK